VRQFDNGMSGTLDGAAPLVDILVYSEQDHAKHGGQDFTSGGVDTGTGRLAVQASADLISMGMNSIAATGGLDGWDEFVRKWIPARLKA
jgi:hypothetical protein